MIVLVVTPPASPPEAPPFNVPNTVVTTDVPGTKTEGIAVASLLETFDSVQPEMLVKAGVPT